MSPEDMLLLDAHSSSKELPAFARATLFSTAACCPLSAQAAQAGGPSACAVSGSARQETQGEVSLKEVRMSTCGQIRSYQSPLLALDKWILQTHQARI